MDELRDYSIVVGGHEDSSNNHKKNTIWRKLKKFLPGTKPYRKSCYDLNIHKIYLGDGNNAVVERKEYVSSKFLDDVSRSDVNAVKIRLTEEKSKRLLLQNDVETLMGKVEELERKQSGQTTNNEFRRPPPTPVHFNVKLTTFIDVDALHIIVFDKVIENAGEGYSTSTGIFRAKLPGQYQFALSILSKAKAQYAHVQLMKNNEEIGRVFAGSDVAGWPQSGSCTFTTHLAEGDEVYAREFPGHTGHLHGDSFCSFSGVLLRAKH